MNKGEEKYTLIEPGSDGKNYIRDIWFYRTLFQTLAWRDVKVRYKQTSIGIAWAVIRPLFTLVIFVFVFGKIADLPSEGDLPYTLLVLFGILPWQFFSNTVTESSNSLIGNENLITKVYFPRIIIPTSTILVGLIDFGITAAFSILLIFYFKVQLNTGVLLLPLFLIMLMLLSLGLGYLLAAFNVRYRDFRYALPFILQLGLYATPVGFSSSVIPDFLFPFYYLNPMLGIIDGFRWCLSGAQLVNFPLNSFLFTLFSSIFIFFLGYSVFRKMEKSFADII